MNIRHFVDRYFIKRPGIRKFVTRMIEGDKNIEINLLGSHMKINSTREHGYLRASRVANWSSVFGDEAPVIITLAFLLPNIDTIVDAGANVGLFSCSLGKFQRLLPNLKVFAFEADPETYKRLQFNMKKANQQSHNVALSNEPGLLTFIRGAVSHVTTTKEQANDYSLGDEFKIESRRLDSFDIPGKKILLKIDVEGQELRVLEGAKSWFDENRIVSVYLDGFEFRNEVLNFLKGYDFEFRDGRTLNVADENTFSLLAIRKDSLIGIK